MGSLGSRADYAQTTLGGLPGTKAPWPSAGEASQSEGRSSRDHRLPLPGPILLSTSHVEKSIALPSRKAQHLQASYPLPLIHHPNLSTSSSSPYYLSGAESSLSAILNPQPAWLAYRAERERKSLCPLEDSSIDLPHLLGLFSREKTSSMVSQSRAGTFSPTPTVQTTHSGISHSPHPSQAGALSAGASPGASSPTGTSSLTKIVVAQVYLLLSTIKEDKDDPNKWELHTDQLRKVSCSLVCVRSSSAKFPNNPRAVSHAREPPIYLQLLTA
jgi:hypothetical protein